MNHSFKAVYVSNFPMQMAMVLPRNSPFHKFVNFHTVKHIEMGTLDFLKKRWQPPRKHCRHKGRKSEQFDLTLGLEKLIGLFTLLGVGFSSAVFLFGFESVWWVGSHVKDLWKTQPKKKLSLQRRSISI